MNGQKIMWGAKGDSTEGRSRPNTRPGSRQRRQLAASRCHDELLIRLTLALADPRGRRSYAGFSASASVHALGHSVLCSHHSTIQASSQLDVQYIPISRYQKHSSHRPTLSRTGHALAGGSRLRETSAGSAHLAIFGQVQTLAHWHSSWLLFVYNKGSTKLHLGKREI